MKKFLLALALTLSAFTAAPLVAEDQSLSGEIRSQEQFVELFEEVDAARLADPMPLLDPKSPNLYGYWRCDAWPVTTPGFNYYWIHTNVNVARANALNLCVANFGLVCNYWCRF